MKRIVRFIIDTLVAYVFGVLFFIPIINVSLLRVFMNDSLELKARLKNEKKRKSTKTV